MSQIKREGLELRVIQGASLIHDIVLRLDDQGSERSLQHAQAQIIMLLIYIMDGADGVRKEIEKIQKMETEKETEPVQ